MFFNIENTTIQIGQIVGHQYRSTDIVPSRSKIGFLDIPKNIDHLIFDDDFNTPIYPTDIPRYIKKVEFGKSFNHGLPVHAIHDSVEDLTFGDSFNQPIYKDVIPPSVKRLKFGRNFNQNIL